MILFFEEIGTYLVATILEQKIPKVGTEIAKKILPALLRKFKKKVPNSLFLLEIQRTALESLHQGKS